VRKAITYFTATMVVVGLAFAAAFILLPKFQDRLFGYFAARQLVRASPLPNNETALRVILCGTSSPLPTRAGAKSCTLVAVGKRLFLVDIGPEASENLGLWRVPTPNIEGVFITHFHSDHIGELGEINMQGWAQGRTKALQVYGPMGIKRVVDGFNEAYSFDHIYRNALHSGDTDMLPLSASAMDAREFSLPATPDARGVQSVIVYDQDGLRVTAIKTNHAPVNPAVSYRFDYRGRSVVVTGDTTAYKPLAIAALKADVLISEAQASHLQDIVARAADEQGQPTLGKVLRDTRRYHITPVQAARLANQAKVRMLVYTHIAPPIVNPAVIVPWKRGVSKVRPDGIQMGYDGMMITIPVSGAPIRFDNIGDL
jgi:ribonuclease Z